jgi:hypothetical protein
MAQACGKRFPDWNRLVSTKSYLDVLSKSVQIPVDQLIDVNESTGTNEDRGTWGHPKVAIRFAQWCSDDFAVQVDVWVDELVTKGSVSLSTPKTYIQALKDLVAAEEEKERLAIEVKMLEQDNERLAEITDELFDYSSIIRIAKFNGVDEKQFKWQRLKSTAIQLGLEIKSAPCPRFARKLLYPHAAWRKAYPDTPLPETLVITQAKDV